MLREEIEKKEGLEEARQKKLDWKERYLTNSLIQLKTKSPEDEADKLFEKEEKDKRLELQKIKKSMYKLRHKEKQYKTNNEYLTRITTLEDKIKAVEDILEKVIREEEELVEICIPGEKENKVSSKVVKEEMKKKKDEILGERWGMMKWITNFLEENTERWAREKQEREKAAKDILAAWEVKTRLEKIKELKIMKKTQNQKLEKKKMKAAEIAKGWKVWRLKEDIDEDENPDTSKADETTIM